MYIESLDSSPEVVRTWHGRTGETRWALCHCEANVRRLNWHRQGFSMPAHEDCVVCWPDSVKLFVLDLMDLNSFSRSLWLPCCVA
eukprot:s421_g23.t1